MDFTGEKRRIGVIMDELDGISSSNDKGGINELLDTILSYKKLQLKLKERKAKENNEELDESNLIINYKNPIICTCNQLKTSKFSTMIKKSIVIKLNKAFKKSSIKFMKKICKLEKFSPSENMIENIYKKSFGDYRQMLYNLYD